MTFLVIKLLVSILVVIAITEISKRVNPELGGIISGLPLGTGLSVYFISYEMGTDYILHAIPWGITGLVSSILFCLAYFMVGRYLVNCKKNIQIIFSSFLSILLFIITGYVVQQLDLSLLYSVFVFAIIWVINIKLLRKFPRTSQVPHPGKTRFYSMLLRAITVSCIILLITTIAPFVGNKWSAILSSFPSTLYVVILALHMEEGHRWVQHVIIGFSYGISALMVFYLLCYFLLPLLGLNIGFIIIFLCCIVYLYLFNKFKKFIMNSTSSS
ncbi:putative membrane protein (GlpM family) [Paenibacillus sp. DS2015]|uniref:hypothetical protein n=1 Tax=Paenibacillus sp. DS2015 TaxID=3373917 RepID=UPI003D2399F4